MKYLDDMWMMNQSSIHLKFGDLRPDNKKQGSSDETIEYNIEGAIQFVTQTYNNLLREQVAPEIARMVLPQNLYTEWYWSGTLMNFSQEYVICVVQKILNGKPDRLQIRLIDSVQNSFHIHG